MHPAFTSGKRSNKVAFACGERVYQVMAKRIKQTKLPEGASIWAGLNELALKAKLDQVNQCEYQLDLLTQLEAEIAEIVKQLKQ